MPKTRVSQETELTTRSIHTKVGCEVSITIDGREIPTMSTIGEALDKALITIQAAITESYVVPPRI